MSDLPNNDEPERKNGAADAPWVLAEHGDEQPTITRREPLEPPRGMPNYDPRPFEASSFTDSEPQHQSYDPYDERPFIGRYNPPVDESHYEPTPFDPPIQHSGYEPVFTPVEYVPEPPEETVRQSGLAWSAGVVFFGSVVFMMFLGWGADLLLGSSPWGLVGGIVLGSVIGFVQFFRISSQIFSKKPPAKETSLFSGEE